MLNSKSVLFVSLLLATQLASAGGLVIEKQITPPFDESLYGSVILENQADNGGVVLEKGIIVQGKLAGGLIIEQAAEVKDEGGVILERGGIKLLSGGVIIEREHLPKRGGVILEDNSVKSRLLGGVMLERGIIVQKNQLAGGLILETAPQPDGIIVHDRKLAGGLLIERGGIIMEDLHLAGGLIIDRRGNGLIAESLTA